MKMLLSLTLAVLMSLTPVLATPVPTGAQTPTPTPTPTFNGAGLTVPVEGIAKTAGRVRGNFTIQKFVEFVPAGAPANTPPVLGAFGTLTLQTANGRMLVTQTTIPAQVSTPATGGTSGTGAISIQQLTCEVLDLTLGPLHLELLGLVIDLNQVHLTIVADPAGGLLGQLLCAVANLLGLNAALADLVAALNNLIAVLGGLGL
jgi:hypothetical protein